MTTEHALTTHSIEADVEIVRAAAGDLDDVTRIITTAFAPIAVCRWLVPDDTSRERVLRDFFGILTRHAAEHGYTHIATRVGAPIAAAVWFPRTAPLPDIPDYPARLAAATGAHLPRFHTLDERFEEHHPTDPHDHLALLGVMPAWQGKGIGSLLLRHAHTRLDQVAAPAYLEACDENSQRLYARNGYLDLGDPIDLPDGPPIFPMWRPGRP
ncbi:N-acetyltransferase [Longispora fulva]|uniref:GNAT superfamily N-acetyltransferase n=1 Tax=Longispora fulva TaxID=619741 RepID=A0A8J7G955_9ACTN|nr:GNAT family N-acetyltransferase [Longispora fulva]MBG6136023.1 GNAT superfamily N-acetyltransferase [Longispora fulva]GIG55736.1 N-acetyltransferase [Longispora fulva]